MSAGAGALPQPGPGFSWRPAPWGAALVSDALAAIAPHAFAGRALGLAAAAKDDSPAWALLGRSVGVEAGALVRMHQVHGAASAVVTSVTASGPPLAVDIVASADPAVALVTRGADCVPLLLADRGGRAVVAAHAGWRGLAAGVPGAALAVLEREFGCAPAEVVAAAGPSIGPCCYEVGDDVMDAYAAAGHRREDIARWFAVRGEHWTLDLWCATCDQLVTAGVPPGSIATAELCTRCNPAHFPSHRGEGAGAGRLAGVIRPGFGPR